MDALIEFVRPFLRWEHLLEVLLLYAIIYAFLRFTEGSRGAGVLKGVAFFVLFVLLAVSILARWWNLEQVRLILHFAGGAAITALIVIFQPELRRALAKLGQTPFLGVFMRGRVDIVEEIVCAVGRLSKNKIGALVAFERDVDLSGYVERGVSRDAEVRSELVLTIFYPGTELHDGAVVLQGGRIAAAGCLFPFTDNPALDPQIGTRHRAGIGITEETDAICVIVSEETGIISLAVGGELERGFEPRQLETRLRELYVHEQQEAHKTRSS